MRLRSDTSDRPLGRHRALRRETYEPFDPPTEPRRGRPVAAWVAGVATFALVVGGGVAVHACGLDQRPLAETLASFRTAHVARAVLQTSAAVAGLPVPDSSAPTAPTAASPQPTGAPRFGAVGEEWFASAEATHAADRIKPDPATSASPSSSASASAMAQASASASASASAPDSAAPSTSSASGSGRFGLPFFDDLQPVADSAGISTAQVAAQVRAGTTLGRIASYPMAQWFVDWHDGLTSDVAATVDAAAAQGSVATLVTYDIPHRDCGAYSAGGASSADDYRSWIDAFVKGLGTHRAVIVIEPDAIGLAPNCLSASDRAERYGLMKYAVDRFAAQGSWTYLDAGNSAWLSVADAAAALKAAGIDDATGFSLNTAQSRPDSELIPYGDRLSAAVGGKHYVIDSSRNGVAPTNYDWCNPGDKGLGHAPTAETGHSTLDAYLWIKTPGGSDGNCNGGGNAGSWFASYADMLLRNAHL